MENEIYKEKVFKLVNDNSCDEVGEVYIACPNSEDEKHSLLIALHGSGRGALSYRDVPFYARQRDLAIKCGYIFACISNGSDTFGTDKGYSNIIALYEYMKEKYNIYEHIALWATSAGGLMMHRFYRNYPNKIKLLLGTFPLFNMVTTNKLQSLLIAYGASNEKEFIELVKEYAPDQYPLDIYKGTKVVIAHGKDDNSVFLSQSEELLTQVNTYGGDMDLIKTTGGHSIENFALYETDLFEKALLALKRKNK